MHFGKKFPSSPLSCIRTYLCGDAVIDFLKAFLLLNFKEITFGIFPMLCYNINRIMLPIKFILKVYPDDDQTTKNQIYHVMFSEISSQ